MSPGKYKREKVFLDSCVLLTAVCYDCSNSAGLLQRCKKGDMLGIISQKILDECYKKTNSFPTLQSKLDELVSYLEVVEVSDEDLKKYATIADPNDRHILAGAEIACANYVVTLDWKHFLSSSAKKTASRLPNSKSFSWKINQSLSR